MKLKNPSFHLNPALAFASVILASPTALQAVGIFNWSGAGANGGWATAANWDSAISSDNQTDLVFNTTTRTLATSGNGSYIGGSKTARSITYGTGINASIATSFNFFNATTPANVTMSADIGNAKIEVLSGATGNVTLGQASGVGSNSGGVSLTSNLDVIHNGSGQITFNTFVTGTGALTKTGTGTLAFTGGAVANNYSGLTTVSGGGLTLSKTAATDAIAGNVLINGTGLLALNAANQIKDTSNVEVAAGTFSLSTFAETVNGLKLNGGAITGSGGLTSTTAFDLQSGTVSGVLAGSAGAIKTGAGTVTLSAFNTLTGNLNINEGTLIANTSGAAGQELNTATAINLGGGTLEIRANFQNKTYATPPLTVSTASTLAYNNVNASNYTAAFTGTGFVLNADLAVKNISDPANTNGLNLARAITGSGKMTVTTFNNIASSSDSFGLGRVLLSGNNSAWNGNLVVSRGTVSLSGNAVNAAGIGDINLGTTADTFGAGVTFFPTGANGSTVTYPNNVTVTSGGFRAIKGGGTDHSVKFTGNVLLNGDLTLDHTWSTTDRRTWLSGNVSGAGGLTITRAGGSAGTTALLSGTNTYLGNTTVATGASLSINSTGSVTSNISVQSGARIGGGGSTSKDLTLAAGAKFIFFYSLTYAPFTVGGTATLDNSFGISSLVGGSQGEAVPWATIPDGTYTLIGGTASTFNSITNFGLANAATVEVGRVAYFQNGGGSGGGGLQLVVTSAVSGYAAWQAANGNTSGGLDEDHDNDGVDNGTEYFLGGNTSTTGFTPLPGIDKALDGTLSVTWIKAANGYSGVYDTNFVVETSSTLAAPWTPVASGSGVDKVEITTDITGDKVKYTFPAGTKNFARLKVTGP
jgi:autotransporter-associated beta strand protein